MIPRILGLTMGAVICGLVAYFVFHPHFKATPSPVRTPQERQNIPSPSPLELPPPAPVPSSTFVPFALPRRTAVPFVPRIPSGSKPRKEPKRPIPTKWEILNKNLQIIELDMKYYQIASESDQYGYKDQAILYYKKYLSIFPNGPRSSEVRARLSELESSP